MNEKQLHELTKEGSDNKTTTEMKVTLNQTNKTRILVIGKPVYTNQFDNEKIEFKFVEAGAVHDYQFPLDCESYWVLSYELDNKDQFLLNANDSYSQIDKTKINICKNFNQVKELLNQNNRIRERFL